MSRLAKIESLPLIAAARTRNALQALADEYRHRGLRIAALDAAQLDAATLSDWQVAVVIDTVGPFQRRDRRLASLCASQGVHYIDLADDRAQVLGIREFDDLARANNALLVSGASTVPALSCAAVDRLAGELTSIERISIAISPGYRGPRGLATVRSITSYVGRPISIWRNGAAVSALGWSETQRYRFPAPLGSRYCSLVDLPDYSLMPERYPGVRDIDVRAGLEVAVVHRLLALLGRWVAWGLIRDLPAHSEFLLRWAKHFDRFGSDRGGMLVRVTGRDPLHSPVTRQWSVVALNDAGPFIPATAAVLLTKRLLGRDAAPLATRGAMPCVGLLTLADFEQEWRDLDIHAGVSDPS